MGGKKRTKQFFQKHTNSACKKWEKIVGIMGKKVFYIHTDIVTKKWGKKTHETICPETHEWCGKYYWRKIFGKKCKKKGFIIFTRIS